jgi:hypothetical protein
MRLPSTANRSLLTESRSRAPFFLKAGCFAPFAKKLWNAAA